MDLTHPVARVVKSPVVTERCRLLWLTPDKPEKISIGPARIAHHPLASGFAVSVRGTSLETMRASLRERGVG